MNSFLHIVDNVALLWKGVMSPVPYSQGVHLGEQN